MFYAWAAEYVGQVAAITGAYIAGVLIAGSYRRSRARRDCRQGSRVRALCPVVRLHAAAVAARRCRDDLSRRGRSDRRGVRTFKRTHRHRRVFGVGHRRAGDDDGDATLAGAGVSQRGIRGNHCRRNYRAYAARIEVATRSLVSSRVTPSLINFGSSPAPRFRAQKSRAPCRVW